MSQPQRGPARQTISIANQHVESKGGGASLLPVTGHIRTEISDDVGIESALWTHETHMRHTWGSRRQE